MTRRTFHPTDVIEDADGSLLVADTGSWYMICCPTSKVAKPHVLGGIYRLRKQGTPGVSDPRGLNLDWDQPELSWLSDDRPAVVKRAIEALANERHLGALRKAEARLPALWSIHRISGQAARKAVREFLNDKDPAVRSGALHSVALWRDKAAGESLIKSLQTGEARERRLAAMALGRIGDQKAVKPLLDLGSEAADPFLKHAALYALYEMGEAVSFPDNHPIGKKVSQMHAVEKKGVPVHQLPEIQLADEAAVDPETEARKEARLAELSGLLPEGDPERGRAIFNNDGQIPLSHLSCHGRAGR